MTRTEPDENTYLILDHNPGGPTDGYDYGRHFLFQGHENSGDLAYITRINLDVSNPDHRVTLLTPPGDDGLTHFNSIDGSCWNPFTQTLLFTLLVLAVAEVVRLPLAFWRSFLRERRWGFSTQEFGGGRRHPSGRQEYLHR